MSKFRDYEKYEVFEDGRIWSYKSNKFLKPRTQKNGYQRVQLFDNEGKRKFYLLHRVVWESVTGEPIPKNLEINHIDERKYNNAISNLELLSHKENVNYGSRNARASKSNTNNPKLLKSLINNPKRSKIVGAFKNGELIMTFPSTRECGRNGFDQGNVAKCCRNCYIREGNNVYKGFEWRFI